MPDPSWPLSTVLGGSVDLGAVIIAVVIDWAVIGGEDDDGILAETGFFQSLHDLTSGPVKLNHGVAAVAELGLALESWVRCTWHMDVLGGEVEEEGFFGLLLLADVFLGFLHEDVRHGLIIPESRLPPHM